jgi:spermidine/putrescine transport system substrate-binding protein
MDRIRQIILLFALIVPILSACGNQAANSPAGSTATAPPGEATSGDGVDRSKLSDELYFYNWSNYIDPETLELFEQEYGVRVIQDSPIAFEDIIAKVRTSNSGFDVVVPPDYMIQTMIEEELVHPLDKSLLTNLRHIDPYYLGIYFDPENRYSVPYLLGTTGIAYNREFFPNGVDSWATLFDPANLSAIQGKVSMLDDVREGPGAALKFLGQSLNTTDPVVLQQAQDLLTAQKPFLAAYNSSDVNRKLASGEYVVAHSWSGMAMQARNGLGDEFSGNPAIEFVVPKEGGTIWADNLVILQDSPNTYTAHVFINFLMRPEIAARNAGYVGYITPNKDAVPLLPQEVRDFYASGLAPNEDLIKRLEWIKQSAETAVFADLWAVVKGE